MTSSIEKLRVYGQAVELEDSVYRLTKKLSQEQFYPLGNELHRASAAVVHHIYQAHEHYSYTVKLTELDGVRQAIMQTQQLLQGLSQPVATNGLVLSYTTVLKQSWGLTRYFRGKLAEQRAKAQIRATDELVAARTTN